MNVLMALLIPLVSIFMMIAVHVIVIRRNEKESSPRSRQALTFSVALKGNLALMLLYGSTVYYSSFRPGILDLFSLALMYNSLAYFYFHFFNMSETARRIRVVQVLYPGEKNIIELATVYSGDAIDERIERLVGLGQLSINANRELKITSKLFFYVSLLFIQFRKLLGFGV